MLMSPAESAAAARQRLAGDPHRPRYHFLAPAMWLNDPNGLIHWRGDYHLFYQFNPLDMGNAWGGAYKVWGHAVSPDLVHWRDLPVALTPTPGGLDQTGCWSGCAVEEGGLPSLLYTGRNNERPVHEPVCLAVSYDGLLSWEKSPHNPVLDGPPPGYGDADCFRDPYLWRAGDEWRMVIGSNLNGGGGAVLQYASSDLVSWRYLGPLLQQEQAGGDRMWECPNFFPLGGRQVLAVSRWDARQARYFVGQYDGRHLRVEQEGALDSGEHFYAPQTFMDDLGRRVVFGWAWEGRSPEAQQRAGWAGVLSLPRVLSLDEHGHVCSAPAPEVETLRGRRSSWRDVRLAPGQAAQLPVSSAGLEIELVAEPDSGGVELQVLCAPDLSELTAIGYDPVSEALYLDRERASLDPECERGRYGAALRLEKDELLHLRVFVDQSIVEVFANGSAALTSRVYPTRRDSRLVRLQARGGPVRVRQVDVWPLRPVWPVRTEGT